MPLTGFVIIYKVFTTEMILQGIKFPKLVPKFVYVLTQFRIAFSCQHEKLFSVVRIQIAQNWNKFFTHTEHRSEAVDRGGLENTPEHSLPSHWIPVLAPTYSLPQRSI